MQRLDDEALEQLARYFGALAAATRLKILAALREGERNVGELTEATGATQANVSKHLAVLAAHGLVEKTPRGTSVFYRIADPRTYEMCEMVCGQIGERYLKLGHVERLFAASASLRRTFARAGRGRRRGSG